MSAGAMDAAGTTSARDDWAALPDDALAERLRACAMAYPEEMFPPLTDDDRRSHGVLVSRAAAAMGRHFAPLFTGAAGAIERLQQRVAALESSREPHGESVALNRVDSDFAHRLATMLECTLLDRPGSWDEACALLDEYRAASRAVMAPVPDEGNGCTCSVLEAAHGHYVDCPAREGS